MPGGTYGPYTHKKIMVTESTSDGKSRTYQDIGIYLSVTASTVMFIVLVLTAASEKSETIDEGLFIAGGAVQVQQLNPNIDLSHPPLLRWLSGAFTTLLGNARIPGAPPVVSKEPMELFPYKIQEVFDYSIRFFYESPHDHDRVLFWGRFPFVFLGALLGLILFATARRYFGIWPAFGAFLTFLFTPEILAHSQWAHADLASTLSIFMVSLALFKALSEPSLKNDILLGALSGLAVSIKLTALIYIPLVLVLLMVFEKRGLLDCSKRIGTVSLVAYVSIIVAYLPQPRLFMPHEFYESDLSRIGIVWLEPLIRHLPLPDSFLKGVIYTLLLGQHGQVSFFHGQISTTGWWYYFPAAIFLKYPTCLLIVGIGGLVALWRSALSLSCKVSFSLPPFVVSAAAMLQSVNIGVRSVLPIAPFLAFWCAVALWHWKNITVRLVFSALLVLSMISGIAKYPDFLTYFNPLMGGTSSADKWLVDSNVDWGQDLPALAKELQKRGVDEVRLAYFGMGKPSHYGIRTRNPLPPEPGWYAVSRSYLSGWWPPGDPYGWLRGLQPVTLVGGSIALFHVDEEYLASIGKTKDSQEFLMQLGLNALYTEHQYDAAVGYFRRVLQMNPDHYGATYQLAVALDKSGRHDDSELIWEKVLEMAEKCHDTLTIETARQRLRDERERT